MQKILMAKATALWLIDNTKLTFKQISDFCGIHVLQVETLANGEGNISSMDPVLLGQITKEEIIRCEMDPNASLVLIQRVNTHQKKRKSYVSLVNRKEIRNGVLWLVRCYPELKDTDIIKFLPTTKNTVQAIRSGTYWDMKNLVAKNPVLIGLCAQDSLDQLVQLAQERKKFLS
ncbi:cell cycle transcriptional regulator TrcR [Holospora curviuscula]|uniref:DUF1013 domain-containing protein n=1 Tax=Holospora curviuscula TaxID=1082868 RepID=A0A2S5RE89_9PROT|nr:cell cycle transcriptional regulator TrcR [Holospora curviuscula]PPE05624.1 hypothetical protein HCUR_00190 [Holospora curviuscula]